MVSFVRNWILPQDSPNNTMLCFLPAWWDLWSCHCFDTGDETQVAITYKDLPQDDRMWCISSHCSVFWGKDSTRWDITEKVIVSMETARTLECLTRTRMCKKVNRFWFKMDTCQQATVSKHYYPPTTNSHWQASDASSVLALLPGTSSCKSRVRVSSHQSMLERNSHTGGWPENQGWHRSQCIDSTKTIAFPFMLASYNGQTAPQKREIKQWITQLPLVFATFRRVGEVGSICPPQRWLELVQTSLTRRLRAENLVNKRGVGKPIKPGVKRWSLGREEECECSWS